MPDMDMAQLPGVMVVQRQGADRMAMLGHGQGLQRGDARPGRVQTVISGVTRHGCAKAIETTQATPGPVKKQLPKVSTIANHLNKAQRLPAHDSTYPQ